VTYIDNDSICGYNNNILTIITNTTLHLWKVNTRSVCSNRQGIAITTIHFWMKWIITTGYIYLKCIQLPNIQSTNDLPNNIHEITPLSTVSKNIIYCYLFSWCYPDIDGYFINTNQNIISTIYHKLDLMPSNILEMDTQQPIELHSHIIPDDLDNLLNYFRFQSHYQFQYNYMQYYI